MNRNVTDGFRLSEQERAQKEVDDLNDGIIQDAVEEATRTGPKPEVLVHGQKWTTTYDRLAETEAYASGDRPSIIPVDVFVGPEYPGGIHWILTDADLSAVQAGVYCPYCLCRHSEIWEPACRVCGCDRDLVR
jgi:hypothetical protein